MVYVPYILFRVRKYAISYVNERINYVYVCAAWVRGSCNNCDMKIKYNYLYFLLYKDQVWFITFESSEEIPISIVWSVVSHILVLQGEYPTRGDILKLIKKC